jgi:hypothetical protein
MMKNDFALVIGAACAGLAFVLAIPQPAAELSRPAFVAEQTAVAEEIVPEPTRLALSSEWRWPLAEEPEAATSEAVEPAAADDTPKRRCRRRRCR